MTAIFCCGVLPVVPSQKNLPLNSAARWWDDHRHLDCDPTKDVTLAPKADMCGATRDVRYGPKADIDLE